MKPPNDYEHNNDNDNKYEKDEGGGGVNFTPTSVHMAHTSTLNPYVEVRTNCPLSAN